MFIFKSYNKKIIKNIYVNHDYNDDPMNESPPKSAVTAWDHENELHDSDCSTTFT